MLPSEYFNLSDRDKMAFKSRLLSAGKDSQSPKGLISELTRLRKDINTTYLAEVTDYWIDDTQTPKLTVSSQITSQEGDNKWVQEIQFLSPPISAAPAPGMIRMRVKDKNGRVIDGEYWYMTPMAHDTPIKCRCSCPDFRFTFMWEDHSVGSLKGRRLNYLSTGKYPPRNPLNVPGICKHLGSLLYVIQTRTDLLDKTPLLRPSRLYTR